MPLRRPALSGVQSARRSNDKNERFPFNALLPGEEKSLLLRETLSHKNPRKHACECPFDDLHRIRVPRYRVCRVALNRPLRYMSERLVFTLLVKPSLANYFRSRARNNAAGSVWTSENPESASRGRGDQSVLSTGIQYSVCTFKLQNSTMVISSVLWRATGQWHIRMHLSIFPRHLSEAVETNSLYSTSITESHKADLGVIVQSKSNPVSASGSGDSEQYVHGSSKRWSTAYVHKPCMHQGTPGGWGGGGECSVHYGGFSTCRAVNKLLQSAAAAASEAAAAATCNAK